MALRTSFWRPHLAVLLLLVFPWGGWAQPADGPTPVRLLILDGRNNHDWRATSAALRATLTSSGRFDVRSSTRPESDEAPWMPAFQDADVVLMNYNGSPWPTAVRDAFLAFVQGGGGVVNIHAANNAFPDWEPWNRMIGLGWRDAAYGDRLTVDSITGAWIRAPKGVGRGAGHGRQHAFDVTVRDRHHPVTRGMPLVWRHAQDELYHGQRGPAQDLHLIASAWDDPATGGSGAHEPIAWWTSYGSGKILTTVLGHHWANQEDFDALWCVGFQTLVARACEWVGTGQVTIPVPSSFPSQTTTSVVRPSEVSWR